MAKSHKAHRRQDHKAQHCLDSRGQRWPGDFGLYGGTTPTPRIDKLAMDIRFLECNVEAQCTPARAAIMTGHFSVGWGTCTVPMPVLMG